MAHAPGHGAGHLRDAEHFPFTDVAFVRDAEGVYDIDLDETNADAQLTGGLESAIFVSLFSDRRARADEVGDPMWRRGWIGDLLSDIPDDRHGSGLWLYEQSRLTPQIAAGVAAEARNALQWMIDDELCSSVSVVVERDPVQRAVMLNVTVELIEGGISQHAFVLAEATRIGSLARTTI